MVCVLCVSAAGVAPRAHAAHAQTGAVQVTAVADIDGRHYEYRGAGECHYTADGSIYNAPAAAWHASFDTTGTGWSSVNLSIWQLTQGGSLQATFHATIGSTSYGISTVKGGTLRGTAKATTERRGEGGILSIDGRTAEGRSARVSITCSRFDAPEENG
jgi:hypothetical protein